MAEQFECTSMVGLVVNPPRGFGPDGHSRIGASSKPPVTAGSAARDSRLRSSRLADTPPTHHTVQPALPQVPYRLHPAEDPYDLFVQPLAKAIAFVPACAAAQVEESGGFFAIVIAREVDDIPRSRNLAKVTAARRPAVIVSPVSAGTCLSEGRFELP